MTDIQTWLDKGLSITDARTLLPWSHIAPDSWDEGKLVLHLPANYTASFWTEGQGEQEQHPNAKYIDHATREHPKALAALQAVLDLHRPEEPKKWVPVRCNHCRTTYPCPTGRAIQDAIKEQPC